jgi:hypothetical protein
MGNAADSVSAACAAALEYEELLRRMEEVTGRLETSVSDSDIDGMARLLGERGALCRELAEASRRVNGLLEEVRGHFPDPSSPALKGLWDVCERAEMLRNCLVSGQARCEDAMAAGIARCRQDLLNLSQRKGLKQAYKPSPVGGQPRFFDSKL